LTAVLSVNYLDRFLSVYDLPVSLIISAPRQAILLKPHDVVIEVIWYLIAGRQSLDDTALGSGLPVSGFKDGGDLCATPCGPAGQ
jgi:hypothetical protein